MTPRPPSVRATPWRRNFRSGGQLRSLRKSAQTDSLWPDRGMWPLRAAERAIRPLALAGLGERRQIAVVVVGCRQHLEQFVHHGEVVAADGRQECLLDLVIARDDRRVVSPH